MNKLIFLTLTLALLAPVSVFAKTSKKASAINWKKFERAYLVTPSDKEIGRTKAWADFKANQEKNINLKDLGKEVQGTSQKLCEVLAANPSRPLRESSEEVTDHWLKMRGQPSVSPDQTSALEIADERTIESRVRIPDSIMIGQKMAPLAEAISKMWVKLLNIVGDDLNERFDQVVESLQAHLHEAESSDDDEASADFLNPSEDWRPDSTEESLADDLSEGSEDEDGAYAVEDAADSDDDSDPSKGNEDISVVNLAKLVEMMKKHRDGNPDTFIHRFIDELEDDDDLDFTSSSVLLFELSRQIKDLRELSEFVGTDLRLTDFRGFQTFYLSFIRVLADGMNADRMRAFGLIMKKTSANDASFNRADLEGAAIEESSLQRIKAKGILLPRSVLSDVDLSGGKLPEANLDFATISNCKLVGTGLQKASLYETNFNDVDMEGADLSSAEGYGVVFQNARNWSRANWKGFRVNEHSVLPFLPRKYKQYGVILEKSNNAE